MFPSTSLFTDLKMLEKFKHAVRRISRSVTDITSNQGAQANTRRKPPQIGTSDCSSKFKNKTVRGVDLFTGVIGSHNADSTDHGGGKPMVAR
jgi:hypothetical protein